MGTRSVTSKNQVDCLETWIAGGGDTGRDINIGGTAGKVLYGRDNIQSGKIVKFNDIFGPNRLFLRKVQHLQEPVVPVPLLASVDGYGLSLPLQ